MRSVLCSLAFALGSAHAIAQTQAPPPGWGQPPPGYGQTPPGYGQAPPGYGQPGYSPYPMPSATKTRTQLEIGTLYVTSTVYGVGMGSWISIEAGITDPGLFLIPPALLGVAAPIGIYFLDQPSMHKGMPLAMAAGMIIGAGEGIGIATYQMTSAPTSHDSWGFRGLARSTALGATAGGVGGFLVGYYLEPSPRSTLLMGSGMLWGTTIGSMFGYGVSPAHESWKRVNEWPSLGGLIGFNVALAATGGLSAVWVPSYEQLGWMWAGAGIGAAISLPVFLLYAGGTAPAQRGFVFMGTATLLGTVAGALFAPGSGAVRVGDRDDSDPPSLASLTYVGPLVTPGGLGVQVAGVLF
jgi:hypothetical protein